MKGKSMEGWLPVAFEPGTFEPHGRSLRWRRSKSHPNLGAAYHASSEQLKPNIHQKYFYAWRRPEVADPGLPALVTSGVAEPCWSSFLDAVVFQEQLWTWDCAWECPSTLKIADLWICKTEKFSQWFASGFVTGSYGTFTLVPLAPGFLAPTLLEVDVHGTILWLAHVSQFSASSFVSDSASCGQWKCSIFSFVQVGSLHSSLPCY